MSEESKTARQMMYDENVRLNAERSIHARMKHFMQRHAPEDPDRNAEFQADFHMVVRTIYAEANAPAIAEMMKLASSIANNPKVFFEPSDLGGK